MSYFKIFLVKITLVFSVGLLIPGLAYAGPGHDHSAAAEVVQSGAFFPRFYAESEQYEIVGLVKDKTIEVFVDQFLTGIPVLDADIEIDFGGQRIKLKKSNSGIFEGQLLKRPNEDSIAVTLTVKEGDAIDILATAFNIQHKDHYGWSWRLLIEVLSYIFVLAILGYFSFKYRYFLYSKYKKIIIQIKERK